MPSSIVLKQLDLGATVKDLSFWERVSTIADSSISAPKDLLHHTSISPMRWDSIESSNYDT